MKKNRKPGGYDRHWAEVEAQLDKKLAAEEAEYNEYHCIVDDGRAEDGSVMTGVPCFRTGGVAEYRLALDGPAVGMPASVGRGRRVGARNVHAPPLLVARIADPNLAAAATRAREKSLLAADCRLGASCATGLKADVLADLLALVRADADRNAAYRTCRSALEKSDISAAFALDDFAALVAPCISLASDLDDGVGGRRSTAILPPSAVATEGEAGAPVAPAAVAAAPPLPLVTQVADVPPPVVLPAVPVTTIPPSPAQPTPGTMAPMPSPADVDDDEPIGVRVKRRRVQRQ